MSRKTLAIYIHYPFCKSKCPYCDFNSHVRNNVDHTRFLAAYLKELIFFHQSCGPRKVTSIFFGGGTPSLMPIFLVEGILQKIYELWEVEKDCEITLETNPTSFEASKFKDLRTAGINRISIGVQALNDEDLKFLGREHSAAEAISVIESAQKIFDNFSFDLIYARPKQTLNNWRDELNQAISFGSKHLSLYQLTIEKGTKFFSQFKRKEFELPDEETSAQLYELTEEITSDAGLQAYEISNYAKKGYECRHNLSYWKGDDYAGIGAGAHSRVYLKMTHSQIYFENEMQRSAIMMVHEPILWLTKVEEAGVGIQSMEKLSEKELLEELILMGLRLSDGMSEEIFLTHFGKKLTELLDTEQLRELGNHGLILFDKHFIKIPKKSRLITNSIIKKVCSKCLE